MNNTRNKSLMSQIAHWAYRLSMAIFAVFAAAVLFIASSKAHAQEPITVQNMVFAIHAPVVAGLSDAEIARRLSLYVDDVNTVFAKQTRRRFAFDPATGFVVVADLFNYVSNVPSRDIDVRLFESFPAGAGVGGTASRIGIPIGGRVELYGVSQLFDPSNLATETEANDYLRFQFANFVHELEHTFGAGNLEYYNDLNITDTSNTAPIIHLNFANPLDPYWSARRNYAADPLAMSQYDSPYLGNPKSREAVLAATQFTRGSVKMINTDWPGARPPYPYSSDVVTVRLIDKLTGLPIQSPGTLQLYVSALPSGGTVFTLSSPLAIPFTSGDAIATPYLPARGILNQLRAHRRLYKAYAAGYVPSGDWYTIFDHFEHLYVDGKATGELVIYMTPLNAAPPVIGDITPVDGTLTDPMAPTTISIPVSAEVGIKYITVADSDNPRLNYCGKSFASNVTSTVFQCAPSPFAPAGTRVNLTITAGDFAGKTVSKSMWLVVEDRTGPEGEILSGFPLVHSGQIVDLLLQFSDLSGVAVMELLHGVPGGEMKSILKRTFTAPFDVTSFNVPWKVPTVFENGYGTVQVTLRLTDTLGNTRDTTVTYQIDNVAPTFRLVAPNDDLRVYPGAVVDFVAEASDVSGVDYMEVFANGQSLCYNPDVPHVCSVTIPGSFRGNTDFIVYVFDFAGNFKRRTIRIKVEHF